MFKLINIQSIKYLSFYLYKIWRDRWVHPHSSTMWQVVLLSTSFYRWETREQLLKELARGAELRRVEAAFSLSGVAPEPASLSTTLEPLPVQTGVQWDPEREPALCAWSGRRHRRPHLPFHSHKQGRQTGRGDAHFSPGIQPPTPGDQRSLCQVIRRPRHQAGRGAAELFASANKCLPSQPAFPLR